MLPNRRAESSHLLLPSVRLAFALGPDNLRLALPWRHNNLSFLPAEGESVDMQDRNSTQSFQLGFSILDSGYPLAEILASEKVLSDASPTLARNIIWSRACH